MPFYEHECTLCEHEWEDFYSINADPPTTCPKCDGEGAKRIISLTSPGVVPLVGRELINKVQSDSQALQKKAQKDENTKANLVGEAAYETLVRNKEKNK